MYKSGAQMSGHDLCGCAGNEVHDQSPEGTTRNGVLARPPAEKKRSSVADARVLQAGGVPGNPPIRKASLVRPVIRTLRLPRPLHPPVPSFLVRNHLRFPRLAQESLIFVTERRCGARHPVAAADERRVRVRPVVARAHTAPVQVLRAVRRRGDPLADDDPEIVPRERVLVLARCCDVLRFVPRDFLVREDLVDVRIDSDAVPADRLKTCPVTTRVLAGVAWRHWCGDVREVLKCIVQKHYSVALL